MNIGAVIVTAGSSEAAMYPVGGICAAQRIVAAFQKAGVDYIAVITGPDDKKLEKQLAQSGIFFLHNDILENQTASIKIGLNYMQSKCDSVFLLTAVRPLISPETLTKMKKLTADAVIPTYCGETGRLMLLSVNAINWFLSPNKNEISEQSISRSGLDIVYLPVDDSGIITTVQEACSRTKELWEHERKLTRPVMDLAVTRGKFLIDRKLMTLMYFIRDTQSVREACGRMQISYSTAWNMLNAAEEALGYPLLMRNKGGPSGAGSLLTEKGLELLEAFERFEAAARDNMNKLYDTYMRDII